MRTAVRVCLIFLMACVIARAHLVDSGSETAEISGGASGAQAFSLREERALGERLAYCYALRYKRVEDEQYRQRIRRVASRLKRGAGDHELQVIVIKSDKPRAVSFPGGKIFLTTALFEELADDDELAAVLAHEAAHSAARHTTRLISRVLALPAEARLGFPTREQILTGAVLNFEFPPALEVVVKAYEREADSIALRWLKAASYRETALFNLLERIAERLPAYGSNSHLDALQERVAALNGEGKP